MATATVCFVFGYHYHWLFYVIHICNLEQFENKVTYLLTYLLTYLHVTSEQ